MKNFNYEISKLEQVQFLQIPVHKKICGDLQNFLFSALEELLPQLGILQNLLHAFAKRRNVVTGIKQGAVKGIGQNEFRMHEKVGSDDGFLIMPSLMQHDIIALARR